jgi:hypothetical protein
MSTIRKKLGGYQMKRIFRKTMLSLLVIAILCGTMSIITFAIDLDISTNIKDYFSKIWWYIWPTFFSIWTGIISILEKIPGTENLIQQIQRFIEWLAPALA